MSEKTQSYEGMFLVDSGQPNFEAAVEPIRGILARREAEILSIKPWDDRKLAYEIRGRKRCLYVLCYFRVDPLQVVEIEHDCRLDERILRSLFLRKDRLTPETINAETPATIAGHKPPEAPAGAPAGAVPAAGEAPAVAAAPGEAAPGAAVPAAAPPVAAEPPAVTAQPPAAAVEPPKAPEAEAPK